MTAFGIFIWFVFGGFGAALCRKLLNTPKWPEGLKKPYPIMAMDIALMVAIFLLGPIGLVAMIQAEKEL